VLLAATDASAGSDLERQQDLLATHKITSTTWCHEGEGTPEDLEKALADRIGRWLDRA
jgi:hypothetical protein